MTIPLEELMKTIDSRYRLVLAAARRANDIASGSPVLVESQSKQTALKALQEIAAGKVRCEIEGDEKKKKKKAKS